ncbi:hypothetical protein ACFV1Y_22330, partial [Streptomyces werraensis]
MVTAVGSRLTAVAVPKRIYDVTGSCAWVGTASLTGLPPLIVFALWGGAIADSMDRRKRSDGTAVQPQRCREAGRSVPLGGGFGNVHGSGLTAACSAGVPCAVTAVSARRVPGRTPSGAVTET